MQLALFLPVILFCFIVSNGISQEDLTKFNPVAWDSIKPHSIPADSTFKNSDIIILNDWTIVNDPEQNFFSITKIMQVKIMNQKGVHFLHNFYFPECFDPMFAYDSVPVDDREKLHPPFFNHFDITHFDARKILPKNKTTRTGFKSYEEKEIFYGAGTKNQTPKLRFELQDIAIGDEIQIFYKVNIPSRDFLQFTSDRFFFAGVFPKQKMKLEYKSEFPGFITNFTQVNGAEKFMTKQILTADIKYHCWEMKNVLPFPTKDYLRPASDMPYVQRYVSKTKDPTGRNNKGWSQKLFETIKTFNPVEGMQTTYKDKSSIGFNNFFNAIKTGKTDTTPVVMMNALHNYIIGKMDLYTIRERAAKEEFYLRPGELLEKDMIYERDRGFVYNQILKRLNTDYYIALISEKRKNKFDTANAAVFTNYIHAYVLYQNKKDVFYYVPKNSEGGYYANEFPFYFEGTFAAIFPHNIVKGESAKTFLAITPTSNESENIRQTNMELKIDSVSNHVKCQGKLILSGQFSTLTRNVYLKNCIDSSINPSYRKKVFPQGKKITEVKSMPVSVSEEFPFKASFDIAFKSAEMFSKRSDSIYTLDLGKMINHIVWENFSANDTTMDFYNDFKFRDIFRFKIDLPAGMKCVNAEAVSIKLKNNYGKYELNITAFNPERINDRKHLCIQH